MPFDTLNRIRKFFLFSCTSAGVAWLSDMSISEHYFINIAKEDMNLGTRLGTGGFPTKCYSALPSPIRSAAQGSGLQGYSYPSCSGYILPRQGV